MAEGDKFERAIRRTWRKAHRIACGAGKIETVIDEAMRALREEYNGGGLSLMRGADIIELLCVSLEGIASNDLFGPNVSERRLKLSEGLESIVAKQPGSADTKLAVKVVLKVFDEMGSTSARVSRDEILSRVAGAFGAEVVKNRFLEPGRDGIMDKTHRNAAQQLD